MAPLSPVFARPAAPLMPLVVLALLLLTSVSATSNHIEDTQLQDLANRKAAITAGHVQREYPAAATPTTKQKTAIEPRVVGGTTVKNPLRFPFFAQLVDASCAAALIHDDFLLSAAHCERLTHPFYKRVVFASSELNQGGFERIIEYQRGHPGYLPTLQDNDFLLLKLSTSAVVDEDGEPTGVVPIPLNRNASLPTTGDPIRVMGFGKTAESGAGGMSQTFQTVEIEYIDDDTCQKQYGADQFVRNVMFCSGTSEGGKDTCQGDSGGPVVDVNQGVLAGVVSYGIGCARKQYAGVNSKVSAVTDWIDREICLGSDYPPDNCAEILGLNVELEVKEDEDKGGPDKNNTANANDLEIYQSSNTGAYIDNNATNSATNFDDIADVDSTASVTVTLDLEDSPTTSAPTVTGIAAMSLQGKLDDYPQEFAWSLTRISENNTRLDELFAVLPNDIRQTGKRLNEQFTDLPPGLYDIQVGDNGNDGICCSYGNGNLKLVNDVTGETIWKNDGKYSGYLRVQLDIGNSMGLDVENDDSDIRVVLESTTYQPSWATQEIPNDPAAYDQDFPGPLPASSDNNDPTFSFSINQRFDAYPFENNYVLYHIDKPLSAHDNHDLPANNVDNDWTRLYRMQGISDGEPNELLGMPFTNQKAGWYWLHITDLDGDGVCCEYRRGWLSITGPIAATQDVGLIWSSDGEFSKGLEVYFYMNTDGYIEDVNWIAKEDAELAFEATGSVSFGTERTEAGTGALDSLTTGKQAHHKHSRDRKLKKHAVAKVEKFASRGLLRKPTAEFSMD